MPQHRIRAVVRQRPELISMAEAAEICDVDYRTIRRWVAAGRLNATRVGPRLLKIKLADVDALMRPVGGGAAK